MNGVSSRHWAGESRRLLFDCLGRIHAGLQTPPCAVPCLESDMKIYVGNLSFSSTEESVRTVFAEYGTVDEVFIAADRETGRSRGFGFVTMNNDEEAKAAIEGANGLDLDGRTLNVNEARPKTHSGGGGGGGRGGGGGGGGGGRGRGGGGGDRW